jgi:hypothetical protein
MREHMKTSPRFKRHKIIFHARNLHAVKSIKRGK